jgi:hypothetical protein
MPKEEPKAKTKRRGIWISYDLGVKGDYEGLYQWLDERNAKECGQSLAFFYWETESKDPADEIKSSLREAIEVDKKTRIYVIRRLPAGTMRGSFIVGNRKANPWVGSAGKASPAEEENAD